MVFGDIFCSNIAARALKTVLQNLGMTLITDIPGSLCSKKDSFYSVGINCTLVGSFSRITKMWVTCFSNAKITIIIWSFLVLQWEESYSCQIHHFLNFRSAESMYLKGFISADVAAFTYLEILLSNIKLYYSLKAVVQYLSVWSTTLNLMIFGIEINSDLSDNQLHGSIPTKISSLYNLVTL